MAGRTATGRTWTPARIRAAAFTAGVTLLASGLVLAILTGRGQQQARDSAETNVRAVTSQGVTVADEFFERDRTIALVLAQDSALADLADDPSPWAQKIAGNSSALLGVRAAVKSLELLLPGELTNAGFAFVNGQTAVQYTSGRFLQPEELTNLARAPYFHGALLLGSDTVYRSDMAATAQDLGAITFSTEVYRAGAVEGVVFFSVAVAPLSDALGALSSSGVHIQLIDAADGTVLADSVHEATVAKPASDPALAGKALSGPGGSIDSGGTLRGFARLGSSPTQPDLYPQNWVLVASTVDPSAQSQPLALLVALVLIMLGVAGLVVGLVLTLRRRTKHRMQAHSTRIERDRLAGRLSDISDVLGRVAGGDLAVSLPVDDEDDEVMRSLVVSFGNTLARLQDRTAEQLQLQADALLVEKGLLTDVIGSIPHLVYWKDLDGAYRGVNEAFLAQRGLGDPDEALGRTDDQIGYADDLPRVLLDLEQTVLRTGAAVMDKHVTVTADGGPPRSLLLGVLPQRGADGVMNGLIGVGADVTHVTELERVLGQSNRLESIGQLAAGIAHEINTPVQFVSDNVKFLAGSFGEILGVVRAVADATSAVARDDSPTLERLRAAVAAADLEFLAVEIPTAISESQEGLVRVTEIVRAMKDFSHPGIGRLDTDVNRAVESTVQVSRNEWKYVAAVDLDLDPSVGLLPCYEGELKQVVLNIIVNAAHAIAERRGTGADGGLGSIKVSTTRGPDHVSIVIADDGAGMSQETRRRIFDPFFTTKAVGQGTGQGLNMAHRTIVQKHGGRIDVQSVMGQGTTFTLLLPTCADLSPDESQPDAPTDHELDELTSQDRFDAEVPQVR